MADAFISVARAADSEPEKQKYFDTALIFNIKSRKPGCFRNGAHQTMLNNELIGSYFKLINELINRLINDLIIHRLILRGATRL